MMIENINAIEYAKAIYELAMEEDQTELIYDQLLQLEALFKEDIEFLYWFRTLAVNNEAKKELIKECFGKHVHWIYLNFFYYLIDKNDEHLILKIFKNLNIFLCKELHIIKVVVSTPFALNQNQLKKITDAVEKKSKSRIRLIEKINPNLIGGIRIEYDDKYYDGSIQAKLNDVKQRIKGDL